MKNFKIIVTDLYRPLSKNRIEQFNGNLLQILENLSALERSDWVDHLATAFLVARSCINCGTGYSPFELVYGFVENRAVATHKEGIDSTGHRTLVTVLTYMMIGQTLSVEKGEIIGKMILLLHARLR